VQGIQIANIKDKYNTFSYVCQVINVKKLKNKKKTAILPPFCYYFLFSEDFENFEAGM